MTAAVPLRVSKVIALKKKTEIVVIFLMQVTFISEFLLKNSNATENYSVITNRNGISYLNKHRGVPPLGGVAK